MLCFRATGIHHHPRNSLTAPSDCTSVMFSSRCSPYSPWSITSWLFLCFNPTIFLLTQWLLCFQPSPNRLWHLKGYNSSCKDTHREVCLGLSFSMELMNPGQDYVVHTNWFLQGMLRDSTIIVSFSYLKYALRELHGQVSKYTLNTASL